MNHEYRRLARYLVHWKTEPATGKWLDTSAKFIAMTNWPAATTGQVQMNTPPSVVRPSANRVKMPVDGEM